MKASATAWAPPRTATTVPTPEMYKGDFSKWVNAAGQQIPIYDPTTQVINSTTGAVTRTPFANNQIPPGLIAPEATKALGVFASGTAASSRPTTAPLPARWLTSPTTTW